MTQDGGDNEIGSRPAAPEIDETTPRLIVGMARAATTWLSKCLNEHPDVAAFGETQFWGRRYVPPGRGDRYAAEEVEGIRRRLRRGDCLRSFLGGGPGGLKQLDRERFGAALDEAFAALPADPTAAAVFTSVGQAVATGEGKSIFVEKTPHHLNWLDRIFAAMPSARVVIMLREPYGFMLSYKHQGDRMEERVRRKFRRRYHPAACALVWRGSMEAALDARRRWPGQVHFVQFGDVRHDPTRVLDDVQRFLGLSPQPLHERVPPDNTSFPDRPRPELRGDDIHWMNRLAGRTIAAAGYERRDGPREPGRILGSYLRLPFWAIWNIFSLRRIVRGSIFAYLWRWARPRGGGGIPPDASNKGATAS